MSEYADDLKYDYSSELNDIPPTIWIPIEHEFEIKIVHRKTFKCEWTGTVVSDTKRNAQKQFRKQYPHIRSQYSHAYGLTICKV